MTIHINRTEHLECIARAAASSITHLPKGNASAQSAVCRVWATPSAAATAILKDQWVIPPDGIIGR
jgi:hypothetical protein